MMDTSAYCGNCKYREVEHKFAFWPCINCWNGSGRIPATNADKIRAMSDGELAEFLAKSFDCSNQCPAYDTCMGVCTESLANWMKQEAK